MPNCDQQPESPKSSSIFVRRLLAVVVLLNICVYFLGGLASEDYLASWREEVAIVALLTLLFFMMTAIFSRSLLRTWRLEKQIDAALQKTNKELEGRVTDRTVALILSSEALHSMFKFFCL